MHGIIMHIKEMERRRQEESGHIYKQEKRKRSIWDEERKIVI